MESSTLREHFVNAREYEKSNGGFLQYYRCHTFSEIQRSELDYSNKVIMPLSALNRLTSLRIEFPMMFSVQNPCRDEFYCDSAGRGTCHCGVLEFTSEEGFVYMPQWMMMKLELEERDLVFFKNAFLRRGNYIKLQPHTTEFINLSDPKAVLEKTLKEYSCLTSGDTITIPHNGKQFRINVVETQPEYAINIIDTDCEVDFIAPLDYKEPEKEARKLGATGNKERTKVEEGENKEKNKFVPFKGQGRQLDGTTVVSKNVAVSMENSSCKTVVRKKPGKLVFSSSDAIHGKPHQESNIKLNDGDGHVSEEEEIHKFQPFMGKKNTLGS